MLFLAETCAVVLCLVLASTQAVEPEKVCYGELGCFNNSGAFFDPIHRPLSVLPKAPEELGIRFLLYSRNLTGGKELKTSNQSSFAIPGLRPYLPFKFVTHGYKAFGKSMSFLKRFRQAFLERGDFNVVLVTWIKGASMAYEQSAANTRVVGAELANLLHLMKRTWPDFDVSNVHLIGHSLGAHICGYAGKRIGSPKVGRITGLDPAGPLFRGTQSEVRIDRSDATYVETVNTNGGKFSHGRLGMLKPVGHANFYVNGGKNQPGCRVTFKGAVKNIKSAIKKISCSHKVAHRIYEYTISRLGRPITAYKCDNFTTFLAGHCLRCSGPDQCVPFGFDARKPTSTPANFFFLTGVMPNFSGNHYFWSLVIANDVKSMEGRFYLRFKYRSGTLSQEMVLPNAKKWLKIKPQQKVELLTFLPGVMKEFQSVVIRWKRHKKVKKLTSWFGNGTVRFQLIKLFNARTQKWINFCSNGNFKAKKSYELAMC